jgi:hypothetical protein
MVTRLSAVHGPGGYDIRPCVENIANYDVQHIDRSLQLDAPQLPHYAGKESFGNRLVGAHRDYRPPGPLNSDRRGQYAHRLNQFLAYEFLGLLALIPFHGDDFAAIVDYVNLASYRANHADKVCFLGSHATSLLC